MKRIENYIAAIQDSLKDPTKPEVIQLCAPNGFGKTTVAHAFNRKYGCQYFSFRNMWRHP